MPRIMAAALTFFLLSSRIAASPQNASSPSVGRKVVQATIPDTSTTPKVDPLKLTLKTSRPQAAADLTFGISVEIENVSSAPVFLPTHNLLLIVPPEINPIGLNPNGDYATYWELGLPSPPAALDWEKKYWSAGPPKENGIATLQPGSRTIAYFNLLKRTTLDVKRDLTPDRSLKGWWGRNIDAIGFVPGDYTLRVVLPYYKNPDDARNSSSNYFTQVAEITLPMVAAQTTILAGAALGGLITFFLLPSLWLPITGEWRALNRWHKLFIVIRGLSVSALLGLMIAILLSRMSDSPFLIKVSVQDFWGAITIGFIAGTSGTAVLQRFTISQAEKQKSLVERGITQAPPTSPDETKRLSAEAARKEAEAAQRPERKAEPVPQKEPNRIASDGLELGKEEEKAVVNA
jgi:hypothetical protein